MHRPTSVWSALAVSCALAMPASADAFDRYGASYRPFSTPPTGAGSFGVSGAALPDGRLLMVTGNSVFLESAVGSAQFDEVAVFDAAHTGGSVDPSFISVSPDGSRIAVGAGFGKPVAVFPTSALGTAGNPTDLIDGAAADYFGVSHYDAAWYDNRRLALSGGEFGSPAYVSLLDTLSDPASPSNDLVVTGIAGASSGVAFDAAGRLYTANGYADGSASQTGHIRVFDPAEWLTGTDFETGGLLVGDVLSGASMRFDADGNLFVGGGDFEVYDAGYLGVVHADAIAGVLAGLGPIDTGDPSDLKRLDPRGDGFGWFGSAFNPLTGELYVTDGETWYATVPSPAAGTLLALGGALAARRRRDA